MSAFILQRNLLVAISLAAAVVPSRAAIVDVPLVPGSASIGYTALVLGLFPIEATFQRFSGAITTDPGRPASCAIHVQIEIASLQMADPARTAQALGPSMLDAAHYPTMRFDGNCDTSGVSGVLLLHGVSRKLHLSGHWDGDTILSTGMVQRRDYGITGLPGLVGQRIAIRFSMKLQKAALEATRPDLGGKALLGAANRSTGN